MPTSDVQVSYPSCFLVNVEVKKKVYFFDIEPLSRPHVQQLLTANIDLFNPFLGPGLAQGEISLELEPVLVDKLSLNLVRSCFSVVWRSPIVVK